MTPTCKLSSTVRALGVLPMALLLLACAAVPAGTPVASTPASSAGASPQLDAGLCGLFTPAELTPFLGAEPAQGRSGGPLESSCEWDAGEPFVMIQKAPAEYFEDHNGAQGYRQLAGIGDHAFVAAHPFGRIASAMTADAAYIVIASDGTDEEAQIEILRTFIQRSPGAPVLDAPDTGGATLPPDPIASGAAAVCGTSTLEVSQVTGIEMVQLDGCTWAAADAGTLYEVLLADVSMDLFDLVRSQAPLSGVGDEAYLDTGTVFARVGNRAFTVQLVTLSLDEQEAIDVAIAIARQVAEGLR